MHVVGEGGGGAREQQQQQRCSLTNDAGLELLEQKAQENAQKQTWAQATTSEQPLSDLPGFRLKPTTENLVLVDAARLRAYIRECMPCDRFLREQEKTTPSIQSTPQ